MTTGARAAVVGFALSNLYLLALTGPLASPQHELVFHLPGSATLFFVPAILDVLLVSLALTLALVLVHRHPRAELLLWSALLLTLPSGLITTIYGFENTNVPPRVGWPVALCALILFLFINLRPRASLRVFPRFQSLATILFTFLALPELLFFFQLAWYGWQARHLNPPFVPAPHHAMANGAVNPAASPRVLWILLDELSYDQVYGHRYPGLQLPNFDRLAAQSTVFTQTTSAADYTRLAMPSIMTGYALRRAQPSASGQTLNLSTQAGKRLVLDPQDTIFGDAQRAGIPTAVAGWYEPYCRILPGVLNRCYWTYSDELPAGLATEGTLLQNTFEPFLHFVRLSFRPVDIGPVMPTHGALDVRRHRSDYEALLAASDRLLASGQPGLTLIHMPIPHPWGFYKRSTGTFPNHRTSYLDNLALADLYIGRVRSELEAQNLWKDTTVLVMGDHSWRTTGVWATSAHWTREEQAASHGGQYDKRPAVILKLSGQQTPATVAAAFDAVRTRALLNALISRQVTSPAALAHWVASGEGSPSGNTAH